MTYDSILTHLGEFGTYQRCIYILLSIAVLFHPIHIVNFVFLGEDPTFRCAVPGLDNDTFHIQNEAHQHLVKAAIPFDSDTGHFSHCRAYALIWNDTNLVYGNQTEACHRWVYDGSTARNSIVPQFDLVCERKLFKSHLAMVIMLGLLVGSLCGGTLSDYFGRKRVFMVATTIWMIVQTSITFVNSIVLLMILKFFASAIGLAQFLAMFVLVAEIVGPSMRGNLAFGTVFPWAIGMATSALVYYLCSDWRTAQLITTVPSVLLLSLWWIVDESPRWLLIKGKHVEAMKVTRKMAKWNKVTLPEEMDVLSSSGFDIQEKKETHDKVWTLLCDKVMAIRLIILGVNWGIINVCYYSFTFFGGDMIKDNLHLNVFIQCLMETGSIIVCIVSSSRIGRKPLYCSCIIVGGIACIGLSIVPLISLDADWVIITLFSIGRFGVGGAFACIYVATAELLPTSSRNFGLGLCSVSGRVFGILAPYISALGHLIPGKFGDSFPFMLFGVSSILCGLSFRFLPETRNQILQDTVTDASNVQRQARQKTKEVTA